ncbi:hypothetical protein GCM10008931_28860 [Oceanobacillus oncorhynchi subsp. oncorhynchi]|uniref:hypothetical protein n=2 Tax=Bacillaceae TaxID=186817 RepID=UPI0031DB4C27
MLRKSLIVTFAFGLMMTVFGVGLVLAEEDENITSRTISNQEAYESLMEVSDYTEAEAHEAVYGSYEAMSDVGVATIWREIT